MHKFVWGLVLMLICTGMAADEEIDQFLPTMESVKEHEVPEWFHDAKFGIFIHWGLYSVPAWAPPTGELGKVDWNTWFTNNPYAEWYLNTMKIEGSPTWKHHRETYGADFDYYDFIPIFNREIQKFKPDEWAKLFKDVGAQYVVLTTKHHDGFTLWPSWVPNPNLANRDKVSRDLVGDLTQSVRDQGLKMGLYYSGGLDWSFYKTPIIYAGTHRITAPKSVGYAAYADAHWRELIDRYQPSVLWNDITYPEKGNVVGIFADYYNRVPDGIINNRWGIEFNDFITPEYAQMEEITEKKWESCRGIGYSFGYNQVEDDSHMLSVEELVHFLVDVVSKNGNVLLNIGPKPDGTIPAGQVERLQGLGEWLDTNGQAIYGTRPWIQADGQTTNGDDVRYTRKGDVIYAIVMADSPSGDVTLQSLYPEPGSTIKLLGNNGNVQWQQAGKDVTITMPAGFSAKHAFTFKITPRPYLLMQ